MMNSSDFKPAFATVAETADALRKKKISASELVNMTFQRIDRHNPRVNAIVWQDREQALARAKHADEALARGNASGALGGVPVTIKESFAYRGSPSTWGLPSLKDAISPRTAVAVERLESAGAIVVGKTNVPVMLGDWQSYNPVYGTTNNPWGPDANAGWIDRRRRRGAGGRPRLPDHRQRPQRLDPDPRALLWRVRPQALPRARQPGGIPAGPMGRLPGLSNGSLRSRPAGPECARPCPDARCPRRRRRRRGEGMGMAYARASSHTPAGFSDWLRPRRCVRPGRVRHRYAVREDAVRAEQGTSEDGARMAPGRRSSCADENPLLPPVRAADRRHERRCPRAIAQASREQPGRRRCRSGSGATRTLAARNPAPARLSRAMAEVFREP